MFKLFSCEWLRIQKTVIVALVVHVFLLALLIKFGLFNSDAIGFKISLILLYSGCGYLFGYIQLKKYTQDSQWAYMINRPVSVKSVYCALLLAALLAFIIVIILPFLIATWLLDFWQKEIIDLRHYQQLAYILGMVMSFYLVACFTVLIKKKSAHLLLMLAILPVISINMGGSAYWLLLGVLVWLFLMVISAVKINLNSLPIGPVFQTTTAIAYQYVIYFILVSLFFLANKIGSDIAYKTQDAELSKQPNSQSFRSLIFLEPKDALISGLHTPDQRYEELIEEIKLSQTTRIRKRIWFHPTKQQLPFMDENKTVITDSENNITWQFSHDLMLFIGKDTTSKNIVAYMGPESTFEQLKEFNQDDVFPTVPWVQHEQIIVKNAVYQYRSSLQSLRLIFNATEDEFLLNGIQDHGSVQAIITNKRLYLFDSIDYHNEKLPLENQIMMPLPGDYNNLWDIKISEVIDRFILSFIYGKSSRHDIYDAEHLSYEFNLLGEIKQLNKRTLTQSPPLMINDLDYMISPAWKIGLDYWPTHPSRDRYLSQRPQVDQLPRQTIISLMLLAIFYAATTYVLATKRTISASKKWVWVLLNTILGLPGLCSFILLNPKKVPLNNLRSESRAHHV